MKFFLGAHHAKWLGEAGVPLFVSRRTLTTRKTFPRAIAPWALDSGGFTELTLHGRWTLSARAYAADVRRFSEEVGQLEWAAPQDWMCEPDMLKRTGLTVADHQQLTIANYLELRDLAPDLPIIPVLQGWGLADYWRHVEAYYAAGVELDTLPLVGVGTVCRRQKTMMAAALLSTLQAEGIKIHGFGFKMQGMQSAEGSLVSADSMAWSYHARKRPPMTGCSHASCSNCLRYALGWRSTLLSELS